MIDLIIHRIPDRDNDMTFVAVEYIDGKLAPNGTVFSVAVDNDNYREMRFDHIVLATRIPGGSRDQNRFALNDENDEPAKVYEIVYEEMCDIVDFLIEQHYQSLN
jgi:hypothetical protein